MSEAGGGQSPESFRSPRENKGVNPVIAAVKRIVNESQAETSLGYKSLAGVYGGSLTKDADGKTVYDITGVVSKIDRFGDPRLREIDDHIGKKSRWEVLKRHPKQFWRHYFPLHALNTPETKRYRGSQEETLAHIRRLGLEDYYGPHPKGIEIKKPEIYSEGINLFDIWRSDQIHSPLLDKVDRFAALKQASQYVRTLHDNHEALGELVASDIIFQDHTPEGELSNPILNLPDIVYNPKKDFGAQEQRATDMMDFMVGMSFEEYRRTGNLDSVGKVLTTIIDGYGPEEPADSIVRWTGLLLKRGRLTMEENALSKIHNFPRLGIAKGESDRLRQTIIDTCLSANSPSSTSR